MENQSKFKQVLIWSGTTLAVISSIIYVAIVYVLVKGFEQQLETSKLLLFVILGAIVGVLITMSLRIQGIEFAKNTKESQDALKELRDLRSKNTKKRIYSITFYTIIQFFVDIVTKGITSALTVYYSISIIIDGIHDEKYILMAFSNIFLFVGLGMLAMSKAYDFYIENHIPFIKQKIQKEKENQNVLSIETQRDGIEGFQRSEDTGRSEEAAVIY